MPSREERGGQVLLNFLELTSYIGDPQGYADGPDFGSEVWPLIRRKQHEIDEVFLFRNDTASGLGWSGSQEVVTNNIVRLRPMKELTDEEVGKLEHWSFYGGHLNVFYQLSAESSLLREVVNLYPRVKLSSDDVDPLGLRPEYLSELQRFIARAEAGLIHFSFAHDADPMYLFGNVESLRDLVQKGFGLTSDCFPERQV